MVTLTGSYSFPIIKKLNLILRNSLLPVGFNVSTVIEIKCFFDSRDFTKFGLDTFMYVSFERFLYINSLYKCRSSMLNIKPVEYVNSTVQGHTSTYTTLCFVLGSLSLSRTKETQSCVVYWVRRVTSESSSHIARQGRQITRLTY